MLIITIPTSLPIWNLNHFSCPEGISYKNIHLFILLILFVPDPIPPISHFVFFLILFSLSNINFQFLKKKVNFSLFLMILFLWFWSASSCFSFVIMIPISRNHHHQSKERILTFSCVIFTYALSNDVQSPFCPSVSINQIHFSLSFNSPSLVWVAASPVKGSYQTAQVAWLFSTAAYWHLVAYWQSYDNHVSILNQSRVNTMPNHCQSDANLTVSQERFQPLTSPTRDFIFLIILSRPYIEM